MQVQGVLRQDGGGGGGGLHHLPGGGLRLQVWDTYLLGRAARKTVHAGSDSESEYSVFHLRRSVIDVMPLTFGK